MEFVWIQIQFQLMKNSINSYFTSNLQPLPKFDKNRYSMASISVNNTASSNVSFSGGLGGTAIPAKNQLIITLIKHLINLCLIQEF